MILSSFLESIDIFALRIRFVGTAQTKGGTLNEERHSFLHSIFFGNGTGTERERKAFEYVCHRVGDGAHLRDVVQEEYVRRNATAYEVQDLLENPRLVETAHEKMRDDFSSGRLDPRPSPASGR